MSEEKTTPPLNANARKIVTLREQLNKLQGAMESDSKKLDLLQTKVERVIEILSKSSVSMAAKLPEANGK